MGIRQGRCQVPINRKICKQINVMNLSNIYVKYDIIFYSECVKYDTIFGRAVLKTEFNLIYKITRNTDNNLYNANK